MEGHADYASAIEIFSNPYGRAGRGCRVGDFLNRSCVRVAEVKSSVIAGALGKSNGFNFGALLAADAGKDSRGRNGAACGIRRK